MRESLEYSISQSLLVQAQFCAIMGLYAALLVLAGQQMTHNFDKMLTKVIICIAYSLRCEMYRI